ncbi:hypothetical protein [Halococcus salsus]|uniref:hypothetical protein n=1 Tax=Halococcus salsus TaxID=2162894 RepID=UPI0013591809|nr:hypothetical protein [Halococcus salsus]
MNWERRLPPLAEDALDILSQAAQDDQENANDSDDGYDFSTPDFTKTEAQAVLVANEEFTEADAEYALDLLYRRGHIYYVKEEVYITPTDD